MRHFFASRPVSARPLCMGQTALAAGLIAACRLALRQAACRFRALRPAIHLATITTAAQQHLHAATRAHIQSGGFQADSPGKAEERWTQKCPAGIVRTHRFPMRARVRRRIPPPSRARRRTHSSAANAFYLLRKRLVTTAATTLARPRCRAARLSLTAFPQRGKHQVPEGVFPAPDDALVQALWAHPEDLELLSELGVKNARARLASRTPPAPNRRRQLVHIVGDRRHNMGEKLRQAPRRAGHRRDTSTLVQKVLQISNEHRARYRSTGLPRSSSHRKTTRRNHLVNSPSPPYLRRF